jgi:structural maintenance of chromosome 1
MDLDDDGTQQAVHADDYGIIPDFDMLEEEDKEVSRGLASGADPRTLVKRSGSRWKLRSPR